MTKTDCAVRRCKRFYYGLWHITLVKLNASAQPSTKYHYSARFNVSVTLFRYSVGRRYIFYLFGNLNAETYINKVQCYHHQHRVNVIFFSKINIYVSICGVCFRYKIKYIANSLFEMMIFGYEL